MRKDQLEIGVGEVSASLEFQDIYFSAQDGLEETKHVYLEENELNSRFAANNNFSIVELGFARKREMLLGNLCP
jgi:tRNA 5-methylaminomethyl-2-thiouridine biosynthesis bifunctional protein